MDKLQKQTVAPLKYQNQPEEFLKKMSAFLETLQQVYRSKIADGELKIWKETLKDYSYQEFEKAINELISNPARYELEDGSIQVWRGMPKLTDVVQVMLENREKAYAERERHRKKQEEMEYRRLEKQREEHPEDFFGWPDVVKKAKEMSLEGKKVKIIPKVIENISPILLGLDNGEAERRLKNQIEIAKEIEERIKNAGNKQGEQVFTDDEAV